MIPRITAIAIASILLGACDAPTAPSTSQALATAPRSALQQNAKQKDDQENCTFARGTTTCTSTVQYQETSSVPVYGGCAYGPSGTPGRRITTYSTPYLVTATTTTLRRGKSDKVYSSHTATTRQQIGPTTSSEVCEPI
ncbi:MAG: hypothetical protein QOH22_147 [Gemmatimonadaceae bacterium]|nr:hypothetical protein [Gemmatimonadaceae bacterium]